MTLLIMLAVIKSYVVVPWWAWVAAWASATWSVTVLASATRAEYRKYVFAKQGETFIKDLQGRLQQIGPELQGPLFDTSKDSSMN